MDDPAIWEKWLSNLEMDMEGELKVENRVQPEICETASHLTTVATTFGYSSPCFDIDNNITNNLSLELQNASNNLEKPLLSSSYNNTNNSSIMSYVLSFENPTTTVPNFVPNKMCHYEEESKKKIPEEFPENRKFMKKGRNASQTQEHIIAERKRRDNITRMFIALSAIIPGLKKMDKATILNNTIDYVKYLQKRVQDLEEQNKQRKIIKPVALCFKENNNNNNNEFNNVDTAAVSDYHSVSNGKEERPKNKTFPNVEARVLAEDVLIRVMCYKQEDILNKLMAKIGAHNLSLVCSNVLPFGNSALSITIIAQVRHELNLSREELVKSLNEDLFKCCSSQHREF